MDATIATDAGALAPAADAPLWLGAATLRRLLSPSATLDALSRALAAPGPAVSHRALAWDVASGVYHVKCSALAAPRPLWIAKINANFPANPARGLPTIQGVAALFDAEDGRLLALFDSPELTALRTGAATALAARHLARPDSTRLLLVGCGRQARAQLDALVLVLPLSRLAVCDLDRGRARAFAAAVRNELALEAEVVADPAERSRDCDVIVTCTSARAPLLGRNEVAPGTFVAAVGSDHPSKQELEPGLVAAALVVVDSLEQAAECGELHHALAAGAVSLDAVSATLAELVGGSRPGRTEADQITLFDSTGIALEDVAAAGAAYKRACARADVPRLEGGG